MQLVALKHASPRKFEKFRPWMGGMLSSVHLVPVHRSAIAEGKPPAPAATHCLPGQAIAPRPPPVLGAAATLRHRVPFQCPVRGGGPPTSPPTAQQFTSLRQATAARSAAANAGVGTTDHLLPVQCSARAVPPSRNGSVPPTAQHLPADGQDTPVRIAPSLPAGWGTTLSDHFWPFQCSAIYACVSEPGVVPPTAQQLDRLRHDTAYRAAPGAAGVCATTHFRPVQCSISGPVFPDNV